MKRVIIAITLMLSIHSIAQNSDLKWQLNAGMHADIYRYPIDIPKNMFQFKDANLGLPFSELSLARYMFAGFSAEMKFSVNKIAYQPSVDPTRYLMGTGIFNIKYSFVNNYIIKNKSFIEPYFKGGIGMTYLDVKDNNKFLTTYTYGGGLAFWFTKDRNFGIQFQELYHRIPMFKYNVRDFFEHSITFGYRFGLKDSDKDGIPDKEDRCPDVAGGLATMGCPDKDGDGIADKDDRCPDDAGPKELQGCPDKDGDGVADIDDACPDIVGLEIYSGCPDTDGDSIPDNLDSCPTVKGTKLFFGCPDTDGDGVEDKYDKCPKEKGLVIFEGCPDTDGDGVPDGTDKCPTVPGPPSNQGCPEESKRQEVDNELANHTKSIFFKLDKYEILPASYPMLNSIAEIIKNNSKETYLIEGHADVTGTEKYNLELSQNRANSVRDYLIDQGCDPSHLEAYGFGIKYPIAPNNTEPGRAKNRRVDITIKR